MRILVTGGTGFVGAHSTRALVAAGHDVTLLVRDAAGVQPALRPLGINPERCRIVTGDVLDGAAVASAARDADALLHAANVYSFNAADAERMTRVNVEGTRSVLRAAAENGLDPIVHVSSTVALLPAGHVTPESPVGTPHGVYLRSKAEAETIARELQQEGAPVVVTNPGPVHGPHDPHVGESASLVRDILRGRARILLRGAYGIVDVRDVATAHARLFIPGRGPRRYLMGGHHIEFAGLFRLLERVVGHRLRAVPVPYRLAYAAGRAAEVAQRRGIDPGFSSVEVWISAHYATTDDSATVRDLGVTWRPPEQSLRDCVAWLHERGLVSSRQAGSAAGGRWQADGAVDAESETG
ncbi:MAG: SDR family NAD(P)-dependent oxidoreductase [Actinomycetota bacterium]